MGTSKILIDGVGIDLTSDTVTADKMLSGTKAHDANGDSVTGSISSKSAQTYTPGTSDQTIAAGQYLSGAQTIKGDADLTAGNIKNGVEIFGVTGTLTPGITPSGTKSITENGTYDVTEYASAAVAVQIPPAFANSKTFVYTRVSETAGNAAMTVVSDDDDVAEHYKDTDTVVSIFARSVEFTSGVQYVGGAVAGNKSFNGGYGASIRQASVTSGGITASLETVGTTATGAVGAIGTTQGGDIIWRSNSNNFRFAAGTYFVTISW